jgi:hypothetical protein
VASREPFCASKRLAISIKPRLTVRDKTVLKALNAELEILPGVSERDPNYVAYLQQRRQTEER